MFNEKLPKNVARDPFNHMRLIVCAHPGCGNYAQDPYYDFTTGEHFCAQHDPMPETPRTTDGFPAGIAPECGECGEILSSDDAPCPVCHGFESRYF